MRFSVAYTYHMLHNVTVTIKYSSRVSSLQQWGSQQSGHTVNTRHIAYSRWASPMRCQWTVMTHLVQSARTQTSPEGRGSGKQTTRTVREPPGAACLSTTGSCCTGRQPSPLNPLLVLVSSNYYSAVDTTSASFTDSSRYVIATLLRHDWNFHLKSTNK